MIGYVTVGSNDLERGAAFYDALLAELGAKRVLANERLVMWASGAGAAMFALCKPYDGKAASVGNGVMIALNAGSQEKVRQIHAKAMSLGAQDEGAPGPRTGAFYGGYFRDLDGNKFVAFTMGA
jgi:predicted lactoylglutathione lyase